ncbi:MAG: PilZ domain-containing protein [Candidatus Zixiibacteriota bacterium]
MSQKSKIRFIHDVPTTETDIVVQRPFKLERDEMRRFVRLEITSPMSLNKIRDTAGNFWPQGDRHTIHGHILNISGGGVLVEVDQQLDEGDVVIMRFTLQDVENLDWVLGLVKRSDLDESSYLVGIEFITREALVDLFTRAQMDLLPAHLHDFNEGVRMMLNKYIRSQRRIAASGNNHGSR